MQKLLTDLYVLFFVTVAMFFYKSKISTSVLSRIHKETFILSLAIFGPVVSEEKSFEKLITTMDNDDKHQVMAITHMDYGEVSLKLGQECQNHDFFASVCSIEIL